MRRLSVGLIVAVSAVAFTQVALAADLPVKSPAVVSAPANNWTGFYIGANVGGGWGRRNVDYSPNDPDILAFFSPPSATDFRPPTTSFTTSGVLGGVQLGYNWQISPISVIGLETDFDWSGMKGSHTSGFGCCAFSETVDEHVKWFGTIRARLGFLPAENLLAYVTGGFAYGKVEHSGSYINGRSVGYINSGAPIGGFSWDCAGFATCFAGSSSNVATGWTVGGGLEYALWQKWTLKAEYLYVSLGTASVTQTALVVINPGVFPSSFNANFHRTEFNVARLGLNYRF